VPRIRSIKPEFWSDETTGSLSDRAKLLYMGMWNYSDDEGKISANIVYLKSCIFPYQNYAIDVELQELEAARLLFKYTRGKNSYYAIPNFTKHQRPDRPQASKIPDPLPTDPKLRAFLFESCEGICPDCLREMVLESEVTNQSGKSAYSNDDDNSLNVNGFQSRVFSVDHIHPKNKGGKDNLSNLRGLCMTCNRKKGTKTNEQEQSSEPATNEQRQFGAGSERELEEEKELEKEKEKEKDAPPAASTRPNVGSEKSVDGIPETLCEIFGWNPVTKSEKTHLLALVRDLRLKGASAPDIWERVRRYRKEWRKVECTPDALLKHWDRFAPPRKPVKTESSEDRKAREQREHDDAEWASLEPEERVRQMDAMMAELRESFRRVA